MKKNIIAIFMAALFFIAGAVEARDGVFIHITSGKDNPEKVVMGLALALQMTSFADVYVFFDNDGVMIPHLKTEALTYAKLDNSKVLIDKLMERGAKVAVCQTCMEIAAKTQYDLIAGVKFARESDFLSFADGRILSLTY